MQFVPHIFGSWSFDNKSLSIRHGSAPTQVFGSMINDDSSGINWQFRPMQIVEGSTTIPPPELIKGQSPLKRVFPHF